eukprot:TRINITY_DN63257_c0_g1_i1.p1 TRINITY_DN63257_c0_g1~~TRINITY_DN63257_c0_g1_i1.p1  ORF type:complete len:582 (-),score=78.58 TRINITY_DN63257_c0_g1_i1:30-1724(-)
MELKVAETLQQITPGECIAMISVALICASLALSAYVLKSSKNERSANGLQWPSSHDLEDGLDPLESLVKNDLDKERFATISCLRLYFNRPWAEEPGKAVMVEEMSTNAQWLDGKSFPDGELRTNSVLHMSLALWRFLYAKKTADARFCFFLRAIMGLEPALQTWFRALTIGEIQRLTDPSYTQTSTSYARMLFFAAAACFALCIYDRIHYRYEKDVPAASVRYELRQRLQRQLLEMRGDKARMWPAGRCAALLTNDVDSMVENSWRSAFDTLEQAIVCIALIFVMLYNCAESVGLILTCLVSTFCLFGGSLFDLKVRRPDIMDLQQRKRQALHTYTALSVLQISESRRQVNAPLTQEAQQEATDAATSCGSAAMLYRKRSFHCFFARLVSSDTSHMMGAAVQMAIIAIIGREAFKEHISVTGAVAVIGSMQSLAKQVDKIIDLFLTVNEGHPSLLGIAEVLNLSLSADDQMQVETMSAVECSDQGFLQRTFHQCTRCLRSSDLTSSLSDEDSSESEESSSERDGAMRRREESRVGLPALQLMLHREGLAYNSPPATLSVSMHPA